MNQEVLVRPPNSLVLVGDRHGEVPASFGDKLIAASPSCIAVGTRSEVDGATRIRLSEECLSSTSQLAFEGVIDVPSGELLVQNILGETYLRMPAGPRATIQIWVNNPNEPDEVCILSR